MRGAYARAGHPGKAWIAGELPKGPTGKIVRREIVLPDDPGL
jgi:acyl-coenzyme A synthetase/AMP-(fatty) acid ligase